MRNFGIPIAVTLFAKVLDRASKKSKTAALWHIANMMKYPQANTLVIRKVGETNRDSTYADLQWAIHRLGVDHLWKCTTSPLEITYIPTGQKILFRGLDNPLKITSISVKVGVLCWVWIEEAFQIEKESDFDTVDESIRGEMPEGLFKRVTITFNPWSQLHWLKHRFFDIPSDDVLAMTTNYTCNEWLDEADRRLFEDMKKNRPNRYRVAGLGDWGITEGLIYENWRVEDLSSLIPSFDRRYNGLDFGWVDPTALVRIHHDPRNKRIYVFDEMYKSGLHNDQIAAELKSRIGNEYVTCDSAAPQSIDEIFKLGVRALPTAKGKDSILNGIQWIQQHDIIIDKSCVNFIREISLYRWDEDKFGHPIERPAEGQSDHCLTGDTIINTVGGDIAIKELVGKSGEVYCYDDTNQEATVSTFKDVRMTQERAEVFEIELEDGRTIKATAEHPVLTQDGWKTVSELRDNDYILCVGVHAQINSATYVKVKRIKRIGIEPVYNMEVDKYHNFAVNGGLIVHNCLDALRYAVEPIRLGAKAAAVRRL